MDVEEMGKKREEGGGREAGNWSNVFFSCVQ